jgi:hypothetical protein
VAKKKFITLKNEKPHLPDFKNFEAFHGERMEEEEQFSFFALIQNQRRF